jgi:hypothetical protein
VNLIDGWQKIVRKAWSFRLMLLAGLLSGCEVILPLYADSIPRNLFAVLSMLSISCAMIARVVAQREFKDES